MCGQHMWRTSRRGSLPRIGRRHALRRCRHVASTKPCGTLRTAASGRLCHFVFVPASRHFKRIVDNTANELSIQVATTGPDDQAVLRVVNRSIQWATKGIVYESERRHADRLLVGRETGGDDSHCLG